MSARYTTCPKCGTELGKLNKQRSTPQLRRQFAVFKQAYFHWQDGHPFTPKNMDHLRRWLQVEAGRFTIVKTIRVESVDPDKLAALLTAVLRNSDDDKLFIEADADLIVVKRADSISYEKLGHADACKLFDEIAAVLHREGMDAEQLLREAEKAA